MPVYTYRCPEGHTWDEVRPFEGSQASEGPCPACMENADRLGVELLDEEVKATAGVKVPSRVNVMFKGQGWTPTFYKNQKGK